MCTDGELDGVWRVEAHAVGVGATHRAPSEVGVALIVTGCCHVVQPRVVVAQQLQTATTARHLTKPQTLRYNCHITSTLQVRHVPTYRVDQKSGAADS